MSQAINNQTKIFKNEEINQRYLIYQVLINQLIPLLDIPHIGIKPEITSLTKLMDILIKKYPLKDQSLILTNIKTREQ